MHDLRKDWHRWTKAERITAFPILFALTLGTALVLMETSTLSASRPSTPNIERTP